jgi:predicted protein tyrosine phosphatase
MCCPFLAFSKSLTNFVTPETKLLIIFVAVKRRDSQRKIKNSSRPLLQKQRLFCLGQPEQHRIYRFTDLQIYRFGWRMKLKVES